MKQIPLALLLIAALPLAPVRGAEERDILEIAQEHPLGMTVNGKPAKYGDVYLAKAVDALGDIPRPWTVPRIIEILEKESTDYRQKLQHLQDIKAEEMWKGWEQHEKRCEHLISLLAASRDPRVAVVFGEILEKDNKELAVYPGVVRIVTGLNDYFVGDPRYHPLPAKYREPYASTNLLPYFEEMDKVWWKLNKADLEAAVKRGGEVGGIAGCFDSAPILVFHKKRAQ